MVSVSESLKSVYERERSSAAHPLRLSISLFARIVSARSSTLASTEEVNELKVGFWGGGFARGFAGRNTNSRQLPKRIHLTNPQGVLTLEPYVLKKYRNV